MARIRSLKPSFFKDEDLAGLDPLARILFAGLWTLADRDGRLPDRPRWIQVETLPYDETDAAILLDDLHEAGFIARYEAGGRKFIQIISFAKHQAPNSKEAASEIPEPDTETLSEAIERKNALTCYPITRETASRAEHEKKRAQPVLARENKSPCAPKEGYGKGIGGEGVTRTCASQPHPGFDEFWATYPKRCTRRVRSEALKSWNKHKPDQAIVLAALAWQDTGYVDWQDDPKFIEAPEVWINQHLWDREKPITVAAPAVDLGIEYLPASPEWVAQRRAQGETSENYPIRTSEYIAMRRGEVDL